MMGLCGSCGEYRAVFQHGRCAECLLPSIGMSRALIDYYRRPADQRAEEAEADRLDNLTVRAL